MQQGKEDNNNLLGGLIGLASLLFVNKSIDEYNDKELEKSKNLTNKIRTAIDELEDAAIENRNIR